MDMQHITLGVATYTSRSGVFIRDTGDTFVWLQTFYSLTVLAPSMVRLPADEFLSDKGTTLTICWEDIYRHSKNLKKHRGYSSMSHKIPSTISEHEEPIHGQKRRVIGKAMSPMSIQAWEADILEEVRKFSSCVLSANEPETSAAKVYTRSSEWTRPRNMAHWCDYLFFDIAGKVLFNTRFSTLHSADNRYVIEAMERTKVRSVLLCYLESLMICNFDRLLFPLEVLHALKFMKFVSKIVRDRTAEDSEKGKRDTLSSLRESVDARTNKMMTRGNLTAESAMLMIAGVDTGSAAMSGLFFYLSRNKSAYDTLCQEIRSHFPTPDSVRLGPTLSSCTYLRACIDETLRMSPPVGSAAIRQVLPDGSTIDGEYLPEGMSVGTGIYSIQHTAELGDPFVWRPERWLEKDTDVLKSTFNAFSAGLAACVGQSLARAQMTLASAYVIVQYDFRIAEEGPERNLGEGGWAGAEYGRHRKEEYQLYDRITSSKKGPMVQFRLRSVE